MLRPHPQYGHFNTGRQGSVIYYAWHNIPCMRRYTKPRNPRTPCQQNNRNLHGNLTRLSGETKEFRQFCFEGKKSYRSSHTAFIGLQMCQINRIQHPAHRPLQACIHWGLGTLAGTEEASFSRKGTPTLSWSCPKGRGKKDRVLWIAWNATRNQWQWSLNAGFRGDKKTYIKMDPKWKEDELYLWLLFYNTEKRQFSHDTFLHVKKGEQATSIHILSPTLFTSRGLTINELADFWCRMRTLSPERREAIQTQGVP